MLPALLNALLDIFLPPRCHICRTLIPGSGPLHICDSCYAGLPIISPPFCSICGIPLQGTGESHPCGRCITAPPPYRAARAALRHEGACRDLIHAFKYRGKSQLRRPLGLLTARLLADFSQSCQPDLLVPVPLHRSRLRSRGFNQSVLLAELLAKQWQIPLQRQLLQRTRATTPQMELTRTERLTNLQGAFKVRDNTLVSDRRIMLVDDVFTTGSTLAACATALLQAGCREVTAVTVAHAL